MKTLADLAVDSQSAKVLSTNLLFHHGFVQGDLTQNKVSINKNFFMCNQCLSMLAKLIYYQKQPYEVLCE